MGAKRSNCRASVLCREQAVGTIYDENGCHSLSARSCIRHVRGSRGKSLRANGVTLDEPTRVFRNMGCCLTHGLAIASLAVSASIVTPIEARFGGVATADPGSHEAQLRVRTPGHQALAGPSLGTSDEPMEKIAISARWPVEETPVLSRSRYMRESGLDFETRGKPLMGIEVADGVAKIEGRWIEGVVVINVLANSPAEQAGVRSRHAWLQYLLDGSAAASSLLFPPVFLVIPLVQEKHLGETYDLIIGVDGVRIHDKFDLDDALRGARSGEIVYLSIVRDQHRLQLPVPLAGKASNWKEARLPSLGQSLLGDTSRR